MDTWKPEGRLPNLIQQLKQFQNSYRLTPTEELVKDSSYFKEECLYCPMVDQCIKAKNGG